MDLESIKEKIAHLTKQLDNCNYEYYVLSQPSISDFEYDALMRELIDLEKKYPQFKTEHSPTQRVGSDINQNFKQVKHQYPMLSLGNTYSFEDLDDFDERIKKILLDEPYQYCCELKYDGTSISLVYENGLLIRAATRGDGVQGDDVTENVKTIRSIPLRLQANYPSRLEMRGEILLPHKAFRVMNKEREERGEPLFAPDLPIALY